MFERVEIAQPSHKTATAVAFLINSSVVLLAILVPMLRPDRLPSLLTATHVSLPYSAPTPVRVDVVPTPTGTHPHTFSNTAMIVYNGFRPHPNTEPEAAVEPTGPFIPGNTNTILVPNKPSAFPWGDSLNPPPVAPVKPAPKPAVIRISQLDPGYLIRQVQPAYPSIARAVGAQGTVRLSALINTRGEVVEIRVLGGPAVLVQAAVEAVRQWRYKPYVLNGTPMEVQTEVTVNFHLQ